VKDFQEIPAMGLSGKVKGKEVVLGSEKYVKQNSEVKKTLATEVYLSIDGEIKGYFSLSNQYRKGLKELILQLKGKYELHVLTGDNDSEKENLYALFPNSESIQFKQSPQDKLDYIRRLQEQGKKVLMIGDGLNDAGALQSSDVGISIADNIYHFSPACDAILEASKFDQLRKFLKISHQSVLIVKMSFALSFLYNFVGLYFAVQGILSPIVAALLMPISSVSVVAFATIATNTIAGTAKYKPTKL
jgi:Cu+-exporting ATPase